MLQLLTGAIAMEARTGNGPSPAGTSEPAIREFDALILWAMRNWMQAHRERRCATGPLLETFEFSGLVAAMAPLNRMMTLLVLANRRRLAIATAPSAPISVDELVLLRILNAARDGQRDLAATRLGMWMDAPGAAATAHAAQQLSAALYGTGAQPRCRGRG
ncbi:hypothetical protein [Nisaea sp.]|uniref:hypothetical protein n=1 Tax=Nisaea sp. TaxID=2024842 RepID=UPI003B5197B9